MNDEELLEWYKNNNANKPVDMSQQDYELNMNKALKLQQNQTLQTNLASQQQAVVKAQSQAQQSASISNEKLMKYLGQKQQASGIATGQTGSDFINANNNYVQNRAVIADNAASQQTSLINSYNNNKLANEENAHNNEINILDKYRNRAIEDEQLQVDRDKRQRDIEQWNLEMEAYKQNIQNTLEDRATDKADKVKAEQDAEDIGWLEAANERINKMYSELMNDEGVLSGDAKNTIYAEIEKYKERFNSTKNYDKLIDLYQTLVYDGK
jgi:hypothetical protein